MTNRSELDWLSDHGVQIDHKGRIIVSLPPPQDEFELRTEDDEPSITDLMRRDVNLRLGGSRGRRRRRASKNTRCCQSSAPVDDPARTTPIGRPAIGAEIRVCVQTSIAQRTRQILAKQGVTLAEVFDGCACELAHAP